MSRNIVLCLLSFYLISCQDNDPLSTPEGYLKYDIKKGASFNPEYESVGYWNGSVYGWFYNSQGLPVYEKLFLFEGSYFHCSLNILFNHHTSLNNVNKFSTLQSFLYSNTLK